VQLAEERGVSPIHVALAYVLRQPFQVVPLIGPRRLVELDDSLLALRLDLTPADVRWLATGERD
jgi:aryl-alcohol dehydrogenase-like predicted oxidoreductase